jgi:hypothetical protein
MGQMLRCGYCGVEYDQAIAHRCQRGVDLVVEENQKLRARVKDLEIALAKRCAIAAKHETRAEAAEARAEAAEAHVRKMTDSWTGLLADYNRYLSLADRLGRELESISESCFSPTMTGMRLAALAEWRAARNGPESGIKPGLAINAKDGQPRPTVVCLCGSTRFIEEFRAANLRETLAGRIVLSIGCDTKSDSDLLALGELTEEKKVALDELHKRKIDLADEILVLNVGGYVGSSTRSEIEYAEKAGKRVRWLEEARGKEAKNG